MNEKESKLPKWAQQELSVMRARVAELECNLAVARGKACDNGATGKIIVDARYGQDGFPLNDYAVITFKLQNGSKVSCMLRENDTLLDINAELGTIEILPRAANCAYVRVGGW